MAKMTNLTKSLKNGQIIVNHRTGIGIDGKNDKTN